MKHRLKSQEGFVIMESVAGIWRGTSCACLPVAGLLLLAFTLLSGCGRNDETKTLTLTGSSTIAPLAASMAKRFEALHAGVRVEVQTGGSSRGIADARAGTAQIGMVSRSLNDDETDLVVHSIAKDGIAIIVHSSNPVSELSNQQIVGIYTGKINDWSEIEADPGKIVVVHKATGRSTNELFVKYFELDEAAIQADTIVGDNAQAIKTVSGNPRAIGYVSIGAAAHDAAHGTPIKLLPLGGISPSTEAVRQGRFPLSRTLNFVTNGKPNQLAQSFIEFAQSTATGSIIEEHAFVPLDG